MKASNLMLLIRIVYLLFFSIPMVKPDSALDNFLRCLPKHSNASKPITDAIYTPNNSSFQSVLESNANNLRFLTPLTPKPGAIIAALDESHIQATIICAKHYGFQIRTRSGGHDHEGLSYVSYVPFIVLDLFNLRSIQIDLESETAWVQAGATIGELYYRIAERSKVHGFPAGVCPTVGIGGHVGGGGYGPLMRKYGLTVDNVIDAQMIDVNGTILNRESMGEDVFWAINGGGGASFGVILSWKIKLVRVPAKVTVFQVQRTLEQGATDIVYHWQQVAHKLHRDLFIRATPVGVTGTGGNKTVQVAFVGQFLGRTERLLELMNASFPDLGLKQDNCLEMSWIQSTLFWAGYRNGTSLDVLLNRTQNKFFYKVKSDYVKDVIPMTGLETLWKWLMEITDSNFIEMSPYGGRMAEISASETPFPHRAGNLYKIEYGVYWTNGSMEATKQYINWSRNVHAAMAPYVSNNPREAFLNYRDLDLGSNGSNYTDFEVAEVYGVKYFKGNFLRLAQVKAMIDPDNFFKNEQSIPPFPHQNSH
ncbi:berberine bridge enzyme-like 7 [Herrania umbratica]|uniref:Berberine bridge enzyme-like 7 n=1 Tax=Herrania umbratica TaxID=108875 RepID=A0A6J1BFK1_9ROSI|nr:berberine bridge enzyme-like 7 [Herrania umbratica]